MGNVRNVIDVGLFKCFSSPFPWCPVILNRNMSIYMVYSSNSKILHHTNRNQWNIWCILL